jgi:transketolase
MNGTMIENMIEKRIVELHAIARDVRFHIVDMIYEAQSGHPGPALSATDIMTALYFEMLKIDPQNPCMKNRDRFVLSKGHSCPVLYSVLALRGFFPIEELKTLRRLGSRLQGHPVAGVLPGVDATTGSLGIGACQAVGMALEARMLGQDYNIWALLGDGELDEGAIWETAATAAKYKLGNLVFIVDRNGLQSDGPCEEIMPMESIGSKFQAFNWTVMTMDGHNLQEIIETCSAASEYRDGPVCIIAKTVKGKGVSFMENSLDWHAKAPNSEQYSRAVSDLRGGRQ